MTDVITSDHIASVSLKDADRDPKAFADELGQSFVDYGFAIVRDHAGAQQRGHHQNAGSSVHRSLSHGGGVGNGPPRVPCGVPARNPARTKPYVHGVNGSDPPRFGDATLRERVALARVLARLAAASTHGDELAGFVAAALQQLAIVLDHDRRGGEATLLRECAARLEGDGSL